MEKIIETIIAKKLINKGDIVAVACSGGSDSMALLHYLKGLEKDLEIEVIAVTVDHSIRENGKRDADFVNTYCENNNIRCYKFKIDVPLLAKEKAISLESAGREARYGIFDALVQKGIADKIALAHHSSDQAETILMHLFRGSGLSGVRGMDYKKDAYYIRPMLNTKKENILKYLTDNNIEFVTDETNSESSYTRNYLRNEVFPILLKKWPNIVNNLLAFSKSVSEDDDFINKYLYENTLIFEDKTVKIPIAYFGFDSAVINRIIFKALHGIGINVDIERKHIEIIKNLASFQNGKKVNLPLGVTAFKDYDYITLICKEQESPILYEDFKIGEINVLNGKISVKKVKNCKLSEFGLYIDQDKLPNNCVWRFRKEGDVFHKFGGGVKKLKSFLIDKKIPQRNRDFLPVLASENEVYVIAGIEISEKVKVEKTSKNILKIEYFN